MMNRLFVLLWLFVVACSGQSRTVVLTWEDEQVDVTFNVYKASSACSPTATFVKINPAPVVDKTFSDPGLAMGRFCYHVTAEADGLESDPSNNAQADVTPSAPLNLILRIERE